MSTNTGAPISAFAKLHEIAQAADAVMRLHYPCKCYGPGCPHERLIRALGWFRAGVCGPCTRKHHEACVAEQKKSPVFCSCAGQDHPDKMPGGADLVVGEGPAWLEGLR